LTTANDNTAQTWRDLTDQLTAEQIQRFTWREQVLHGTPEQIQSLLLDQAQEHAAGNRRDRELFGAIPAPHGVEFVWHWTADDNGQDWQRSLEGASRRIGALVVSVNGTQRPDGSVQSYATIESNTVEFDAATVRQIAAELIAAADELDRLDGTAPPFV
jgi:hypothetical protein